MAITAYFLFRLLSKKSKETPSYVISGAVSEIVMILGYYVFEGFLYGFIPSAVNIPANAVQGVAGLILGTALVKIIKKQTNVKHGGNTDENR